MSDRPMKEPTLERWFAERAARLEQPRTGFEEMLAEAAYTPQQRYRWLPAGFGPGQMRVSLAAVAAVVVAVIGLAALGIMAPSTPIDEVPAPAAEEPVAQDMAAPEDAVSLPGTASSALETFESVTSAGLVLEPDGTGLDRVVRDGSNHAFGKTADFAIGLDGRAWATRDGRIIEIGAPGTDTAADGVPKDAWHAWTGADGQPLVFARDGVYTRNGDRWELVLPAEGVTVDGHPVEPTFGVQMATTDTNGRLWVATTGGLLEQEGDDWDLHTIDTMSLEWPADVDASRFRLGSVAATADGSVWAELQFPWNEEAAAARREPALARSTLVRFDGERWELAMPDDWLDSVSTPAGPFPVVVALLPAADGSLWVSFVYRQGFADDAHVTRWDGSGWSTSVAPNRSASVAADEHLFWNLVAIDNGRTMVLYRFDGEAWTTGTIEVGPNRLSNWRLKTAPDGRLWLHGSGPQDDSRLYVIDPTELGFEGGE